MPADPAQLQALNQHDRNKKVADIPHWSAIPGKDTLTAKQLIQKIEHAAVICQWDNAAKAQQLGAVLKGPAYTWYLGLQRTHRMDNKDWATLKEMFLEQFESMITASALTMSLKDIRMLPTERVIDYNNKCQAVFNEYYDKYVTESIVPADVVDPAMNIAANLDYTKKCLQVGAENMMVHIQKSLYEAGLLEHLRLEVSQKQYDSMRALQKAAAEAEARHSKKKMSINALVSGALEDAEDLSDNDDATVNAIEDLDGDDYDTIAAIFRSKGKKIPPFLKRKYNAQKKTFNAASKLSKDQKKDMECWHCGKKGHLIGECFSKKAGKPKVAGAGPKSKQVNELQSDHAAPREVYLHSLNF